MSALRHHGLVTAGLGINEEGGTLKAGSEGNSSSCTEMSMLSPLGIRTLSHDYKISSTYPVAQLLKNYL